MAFLKGSSGNPAGRKPKARSDGWQNVVTGIGTAQYDKRTANDFLADTVTVDGAVELWRGDDLAARIIETVPSEMLRQGFELKIPDDKPLQEAVTAKLEDLNLAGALWDGLCYERAYGGGAILIGANDGATDLTQPLNTDRVRSIDWLTALEPRELQPLAYYANPRAPKFGQPAIFQLTPVTPGIDVYGTPTPGSTQIHESRLLIFPGIRVSRRQIHGLSGWGDSVLTRVMRVLSDFNISWSSAGILVHDFAQAVFKMKGLADIVAGDKGAVLKARMQAVELSRSVARAILIDAEEEFERKQTPVSGLPELLDRFSTRLAAAADMPLTLLMGQSPGGMNATGESDVRFFYDRVKSAQTRKARPAIERIAKLVMMTMGGEPESWSVEFNPLWQPSEKEQAETRFIQAQADVAYITAGVLSPEEVALSRFGGDTYSYATQVDFAMREALEPAAPEAVGAAPPAPSLFGGGLPPGKAGAAPELVEEFEEPGEDEEIPK